MLSYFFASLLRRQLLDFIFLCFRELKVACTDALAGKKFTQEIGVEKVDKSLVANFEILNLVPEHSSKDNETGKESIFLF